MFFTSTVHKVHLSQVAEVVKTVPFLGGGSAFIMYLVFDSLGPHGLCAG